MSRAVFFEAGNGEVQGDTSFANQCGLASAHGEAARQHAAAADAHALAAELHLEALVPKDDYEPTSKKDAICASADAVIQTNTAAEASELAGEALANMRDVQREANEGGRLAEYGKDPRRAHADAAKHHASLAQKHARSVLTIAPRGQEAHDAVFDAEVALTRAEDAESAERAA